MFHKILLFALGLLAFTTYTAKADDSKSKTELKDFDKVITDDFELYSGFFNVYKSHDKLYFEIPDSLFMRDMLLSARVAQVSDPGKAYAGEQRVNPILIQFQRHGDDVFLLLPNTDETADETSGNIKNAYDRNYITPVLETFSIKALGKNNSSVVIDVTDFFAEELPIVTPFASKGKPGKLDKKASYLNKVQAFDKNIELQSYFNYSTSTSPYRALVNRSLVLLDKEPMMSRLADRRISYFSSSKTYFKDNSSGFVKEDYINRFRLEPKDEDIEAYLAGELVEPKKPIIVYVDNGLPERWQKYVMLGIEDWQKAFEACGFKNAIQAKPFPNDPNFNPDNLENTCFRYITNRKINAMGTRWVDPRSGEILKGDIIWYHSVIDKLHDWRLVQCAAVEQEAQKKIYSDELMGRMIRYAAAHEMGHTLGFKHNMRASFAYPVDSLRSANFTAKYGTAPSIMDYARNNYIAQQGDQNVSLSPALLGVYDIYAIQYGYQWYPDIKAPSDEYEQLNRWILSHADNPMYRYTDQFDMGISSDPASQAEALGDDPVKAGKYGMHNLKYIMNHLVEWCTEPNKDYDYLQRIYDEVYKQYNRYLQHAMANIGGAYQYLGVEGENKALFSPLPKNAQQEALNWVLSEISTSEWLMPKEIEDRLGVQRYHHLKEITDKLDDLMSGFFFQRIENYRPAYTSEEYLADLGSYIRSLSEDGLSDLEIVLQQSYVHNLIHMTYSSKNYLQKASSSDLMEDDLCCYHENALSSGNASKINYSDHFALKAALSELETTTQWVKKHMKGKHKDHYTLLYAIIQNNY